MTLQQLEYLIALDKHRHFVNAADACGVTQPTLSMMISKLENELDVQIFDRSKHPIQPTKIGQKIIEQAKVTLREMNKLPELIAAETQSLTGELRLGMIPTLAPYLVPEFIRIFQSHYPDIELRIHELETRLLTDQLEKESIDMFIAATPLDIDEFYEIPLYYEKFVAYFSPDHPLRDRPLMAGAMPSENLWVLENGHCLRDQVFNFCKNEIPYNHTFEAGSIETLVRIIDHVGGYSVIPELYVDFLTRSQKENLREISSPPAYREISLVIKKNFIREKLLNAVADTIKSIIPGDMLDPKLKQYSIRLK